MSKKTSLLLFINLITISVFAQKQLSDQSTPRNTLETLFRYARTKNLSKIHLLCNPKGDNDGDTKELCQLAKASKEKQQQFFSYFKLAYSTTIEYKNLGAARVGFHFGPGAQRTETMTLVLIESKWYLSSY